MEENDFSKRIDLLIKELGMNSQKEFADKIGVSTAAITNWRNRGVESVNASPVMKIKVRYPNISAKWIAFGEGEMYEDNVEIPNSVTYTRNKPLIDMQKLEADIKKKMDEKAAGKAQPEMRPHYLALARAGALSEEQDGYYEMHPVISQIPRYDFTARVWGDSMIPDYRSGDTIACLDVTKSSFLQQGRVHLINTRQGVMLKKIFDEGERLRCVSINEKEYPEFTIPKSEVFTIALVVGSLRIS